LLLFLFFRCTQESKTLPILGKRDVIYKNGLPDTIYATIPSFTFFNQDSVVVNNETYKNKLWLAEFFFTSCPTICPILNHQLLRLNNDLPKEVRSKIQFLSFTIDPKHDNPSQLRKYKRQHHLPSKNWDFLTGNENETHRLGIDNFLTFAGKDSLSAGGYAHSGSFTLVDVKGRVRGVYQITNFDLSVNEQEYKRMVNEIKILYNENLESNTN